MDRDIPLGRIAGIKVGMNPTVLLLGVVYTLILATNWLPITQPDHPDRSYWIAGGAGALLIFVSLLVHEIGHALVARDEGIGVRSMGLTMLGGVTRMESSPTTAKAEFKVSVVGPVASFSWAVFLLCIAYVIPNHGVPGLVGEVLSYAGVLNLFLAAFNLLPATPLDGGKVLSSLIWLKTGSQATAMRWSARAGVFVGVVMVGLGIREIRAGGPGGKGYWLLIVGGFIAMSAYRELQATPLYTMLADVKVVDAMAPLMPSVADWTPIVDFLRTAPPPNVPVAYPVVGADGRIVGLLTTNVLRSAAPEALATMRAADLALPADRLVRLRPDETLLPALQKVESASLRIGMVIDDSDRVVGTLDSAAIHRVAERRQAGLAAVGN